MKKKAETPRALETKFAETAFRLNQERNDFLLPQILDFVRKEKWLNLRPEYQRRLVWDDAKRSLFIESLLLNVPIPQLFLYESELGRYEVMDGQQRLTSIVDFYDNAFALKALERWHELNGLRYRDLPDTLKRGLDRRRLSATVLLVDSSRDSTSQQADIRKLVFERLNTGGQHLNAHELRNCLYSGPFNELLIELSRTREFAEIWSIPPYEDNIDAAGQISKALADDRLYRRMIDCELVLRFFALRARSNIKGSVRGMLDRFMEQNASADTKVIEQMREVFKSRLSVSHKIFGGRTFRYEEDDVWKLSYPLYDAVMVAVDHLWDINKKLVAKRATIRRDIEKLLGKPGAHDVIVGKPNTARAVMKRIELVSSTLRRAAKR
jgi:hypothetical protein